MSETTLEVTEDAQSSLHARRGTIAVAAVVAAYGAYRGIPELVTHDDMGTLVVGGLGLLNMIAEGVAVVRASGLDVFVGRKQVSKAQTC